MRDVVVSEDLDDAIREKNPKLGADAVVKNLKSASRVGAMLVLDTSIPGSNALRMEVRLTPDQEAFVRQAVESGRLQRPEEAVEEALRLWEERERKRAEFVAMLDEAKGSLARGEGRVIRTEQDARDLANDVKRRGRTRLGAEGVLRSEA